MPPSSPLGHAVVPVQRLSELGRRHAAELEATAQQMQLEQEQVRKHSLTGGRGDAVIHLAPTLPLPQALSELRSGLEEALGAQEQEAQAHAHQHSLHALEAEVGSLPGTGWTALTSSPSIPPPPSLPPSLPACSLAGAATS